MDPIGASRILAIGAGVATAAAIACASSRPVAVRATAGGAREASGREVGNAGAVGGRLVPVLRWLGASPIGRAFPTTPGLERVIALLPGVTDEALLRGVRVAVAVLGASVGILTLGPVAAAALATIGATSVPVVVARSARARVRKIDRELPQFLDLLAAGSHAGLSGPIALRRAAGAIDGPLADELAHVLHAVDLGARWRDELWVLARTIDLPDLTRTVSALTRTERLGSSLAGAVGDLAERVRADRRAATTERARTAPVKMLFPLVFLVLPAFLLLTVVPVLFSTVRSIG